MAEKGNGQEIRDAWLNKRGITTAGGGAWWPGGGVYF